LDFQVHDFNNPILNFHVCHNALPRSYRLHLSGGCDSSPGQTCKVLCHGGAFD
jgi:hypothetical protein